MGYSSDPNSEKMSGYSHMWKKKSKQNAKYISPLKRISHLNMVTLVTDCERLSLSFEKSNVLI